VAAFRDLAVDGVSAMIAAWTKQGQIHQISQILHNPDDADTNRYMAECHWERQAAYH